MLTSYMLAFLDHSGWYSWGASTTFSGWEQLAKIKAAAAKVKSFFMGWEGLMLKVNEGIRGDGGAGNANLGVAGQTRDVLRERMNVGAAPTVQEDPHVF